MLKTLTLFCITLVTITCYAQKTQTPITGIDAIKLGDSISQVNTYGFPFIAVTKFRISDSFSTSGAWEPKKSFSINELKDDPGRITYILIDSGKTFCPDVSVFITSSFKFNQIQHSKTATLALTYFKNVLIDIRIIDSSKYIRSNYMYGLKKYGKGFAKQLDSYTLHSQAYNRAVNPSDTMTPPRDLSKVPMATIAKELSERHYIETIYWVNSDYSFSFNQCSEPYIFWVEKHLPSRYNQCGCAEEAIIIKNDKSYKAMKDCSDATLKQQLINNKQVAN